MRPCIRSGFVFYAAISSMAVLRGAEPAPSTPDAQKVVAQIAARCRPWIVQPSPQLQSLKYVYRLGNQARTVELIPGSEARPSLWQGATLRTGLHALLSASNGFDLSIEPLTTKSPDGKPMLRLTARAKSRDNPFRLEVGNGVENSWRGYFSHPSPQMRLDLDAGTLLPQREFHDYSQYEYRDWQQVGADQWIPQLVIVKRGETVYRMHFAWHGDAAWLLTHADASVDGRLHEVARVSQVQVNDQAVQAELTNQRRRQESARKIVRDTLEKNARWLAPGPSFDSLQYTFHTVREDVRELCVVHRDGLTAFEVTHDGLGKLPDQIGARRIVSADGRLAYARRGESRAMIRESTNDWREPDRAAQLRRYALIGCQFDMPLFELARVLDDAQVEIKDGDWNGVPCHVATVVLPGRSATLGCGVMLGHTSWCYVHSLRPAYEVIYIDRERLVPVHETFIDDYRNRRFEIDFTDYAPVDSNAGAPLVPLRISLESKDYFTCNYDFHVVAGRHWLLKAVEAWFKPEEKSRGAIQDVQIDAPSQLADESARQLAAYELLFESTGPFSQKSVEARRFVLGRVQKIGLAEIIFTFDAKGSLILKCTTDVGAAAAGQLVSVLLLDKSDRVVQAASAPLAAEQGRLTATARLGSSVALGSTVRYVIAGLDDATPDPAAERRRLRVARLSDDGQPKSAGGIEDESGKTRLIDVTLARDATQNLVANVQFASRDQMNEFLLDASVGVLDKTGRLLAAASKAGSLRVEAEIVDATWEIPLPAVELSDVSAVVVGLARGQTTSAPMGTLWGTFLDVYPPFSADVLLAADDPGCWTPALRQLDDELDETLDHGLLDGLHDWQEQLADRETPADKLHPRVKRLREVASRAEDPATLAAAIRLLGYAEDKRAVTRAIELLSHPSAEVQDAAAIALSLLRRDEGLDRLDAILARPDAEGHEPAALVARRSARHAPIALVSLRSETSIPVVRKWLLAYIDGIRFTNNKYSQVDGTRWKAEQLAMLMGALEDPRYAPILAEAVKLLENRDDLRGRYSASELLAAVLRYGDQGHDLFEERVRNGDAATLYALESSRDEHYLPAIRTLLDAEPDADIWDSAVDYLWNIDSPAAADLLREAYDRGAPRGERRETVRMKMAAALAHRGDNRGLSEALNVLIDLAADSQPPTDKEACKAWEDERDDRRGDALNVFERAETSAIVALLTAQAVQDDATIRVALLDILEHMSELPDALRSHIERWARDASSEAISLRATRLLTSRK